MFVPQAAMSQLLNLKFLFVYLILTIYSALAFLFHDEELNYKRCDKHLVNETKSFLGKNVVPKMELRISATNALPYSLSGGDFVCGPTYQIIIEVSKLLRAK